MAFVFASMGSAFASAGLGCCTSLGCAACRGAGAGATALSARLAYTLLFLGGQILSWLLRDFAKPLLQKLPWVVRAYAGEPPDAWFGEQAVLRVAMGNAAFFGGLALALLGVTSGADARVKHLHRGSWMLKTLAWALLTVLPFLLPNPAVAAFAWVARGASGVFLVVQMIILLDFAYVWNESWTAKSEQRRAWLGALLGATLACYAGALTLLGLAFRWFHPHGAGDCSLNVFLITLALLLGVAYSVAALHPQVQHGSLLCSGAIFAYNAYLTVSALSSEPASYTCNGRPAGLGTTAGQAGAAMGMVLALVSVAYSAARAGSSGAFLFADADGSDDGDAAASSGIAAPLLDAEMSQAAGSDEEGEEHAARSRSAAVPRPLRYNLAAFHMVFALASCYTAMLLTDWASGAGSPSVDQLGVGWASVWVKVASSWVTAALYGWSLAAPLVFPERF